MSHPTGTAQRPSSATEARNGVSLPLTLGAVTIVLALMLAVAALRLYRLSELPPGIHYDEGTHGVDALNVVRGNHAVFFPANFGREGLVVYAIAFTTSLLGRTILAVRLPTALASAAAVLAVFWLGWLLFKTDEDGKPVPWRGLFVCGVGAALFATSLGHTVIGRTALRGNYLPLLLTLCLALLWWGWSRRSWSRVVLAGVCAGLLPYTYIAARFTPLLFLLFGLSCLLPLDANSWKKLFSGSRQPFPDPPKDEQSGRASHLLPSRKDLAWVGVFAAVAALVAAPIAVYFALNPEQFTGRSSHLWVFRLMQSQGDPLGALLRNVWTHLLVFGFRGDPIWRYNLSGRPLLELWEASFFWIGVGTALWRWRRPAYRLLIFWLVLLLLPAFLAGGFVPNTLRMIGAAPAIYLITAAGVWETLTFVWIRCGKIFHARYRQLQGLADRSTMQLLFQQKESRSAVAVTAAVVCLILVQGGRTYQTYFREWAAAPELYEAYETEWVDLTRVLNAQPAVADTAYLIPYRIDEHNSFTYLYQGTAPARLIFTGSPDLARKVRSTLTRIGNVATLRVVDWRDDLVWTRGSDQHVLTLLDKYARYRGREEFPNLQIHTYSDVDLESPWTFYQYLEPRAVRYDGGIELLGLAIGRGSDQLPSRNPLDLGQDRSLWTALQWRASRGLDADFAISLRLVSPEGAISYQRDVVLGDSNHARTKYWKSNRAVDTLYHLNFPADLEPGDYELRLIVYDAETLTPTVEIDVWEPEYIVARLHFGRRR